MRFFNAFNRPKHKTAALDYKTKIVQQSEADVVGLKYQLERYGMNTLLSKFETMKSKFGYADCRNLPDFEALQNRVIAGTEYFNNLPSEIRRKFNDKPAAFYDYIQKYPVEAVKEGYINNDSAEYIKSIYKEQFIDDAPVSVVDKTDGVVEPSNDVNEEKVDA